MGDPRSSGVRFARLPCVLLVRVPDDEQALGLETLGVRVLRTAHPLQACERARVVQPLVIVLGDTVRAQDAGLVWEVAEQIGAVVVEMSAPLERDQLIGLIRQSVVYAVRTRAAASAAS